MLRWFVILLLLLNLGFWAWHQPALRAGLGLPESADREPQRVSRQINADAIRVVPPAAPASGAASAPLKPPTVGAPASAASAASAAAAAAPTLACLESPPLAPQQVALATKALQLAGVAPGGWVELRRELPGRWAIAMGRFESREQMQRKAAELDRLKLSYTEASGELAPGLILAEFDTHPAAQERLSELQSRGVRTARVVSLAEQRSEIRVRADRLAPATLTALRNQPTTAPLRWRACEG